jgi:hypothetical protein
MAHCEPAPVHMPSKCHWRDSCSRERMLRVLAHCASLLSVAALLCAACDDEGSDGVTELDADAGDASRHDANASETADANAPDADGSCGPPPSYWCVDSCGTDALEQPACGDAGWVCRTGTFPHTTCLPGSCFTLPFVCCRADGSHAPRVCDTQSATSGCSEGSTRVWITTSPDACRPDAGLDGSTD